MFHTFLYGLGFIYSLLGLWFIYCAIKYGTSEPLDVFEEDEPTGPWMHP